MTFLTLMPGSVPKCFAPGSQIFKWFSLYWRRKITSLEMALKCFSGPEFINLDPFLDLILGCGIFFCKNVFFTPKPITTKKNFGFQNFFFQTGCLDLGYYLVPIVFLYVFKRLLQLQEKNQNFHFLKTKNFWKKFFDPHSGSPSDSIWTPMYPRTFWG